MGERKVLNKYIPPDFDPRLVPRGKRPKDGLVPVRMMLPFSIQCSTCHTFMYRGRKFNSKKEPMGGPDGKYLNTIQRYRFYIKCTCCSRPITFLTDPKNADYEMETGGTRNYEVHKDRENFEQKSQEEKDKKDPIQTLEQRALASQRDMAELDQLDHIQTMNQKHSQLLASSSDVFLSDAVLSVLRKEEPIEEEELNENGLTKEEEEQVKSIQFQTKSQSHYADDSYVYRLNEQDEQEAEQIRQKLLEQTTGMKNKRPPKPKLNPIKKKKKKTIENASSSPSNTNKPNHDEQNVSPSKNHSTNTKTVTSNLTSINNLLGNYGSSSDSDSDA